MPPKVESGDDGMNADEITMNDFEKFHNLWMGMGEMINEIVNGFKSGKIDKATAISRLHPYATALNIMNNTAKKIIKESKA